MKFEAALEHQEHQLELKDDKIEGGNLEIQWLGQCVWELEDEVQEEHEGQEQLEKYFNSLAYDREDNACHHQHVIEEKEAETCSALEDTSHIPCKAQVLMLVVDYSHNPLLPYTGM